MSAVEGPDGYDSVEWIASQRWCDGNVGMQGLSYAANLQWITAEENPPHLKAIAPGLCGMGGSGEGTGVLALALRADNRIPDGRHLTALGAPDRDYL